MGLVIEGREAFPLWSVLRSAQGTDSGTQWEPKAALGREASAVSLKGSKKRLDGTLRGASIGYSRPRGQLFAY